MTVYTTCSCVAIRLQAGSPTIAQQVAVSNETDHNLPLL